MAVHHNQSSYKLPHWLEDVTNETRGATMGQSHCNDYSPLASAHRGVTESDMMRLLQVTALFHPRLRLSLKDFNPEVVVLSPLCPQDVVTRQSSSALEAFTSDALC